MKVILFTILALATVNCGDSVWSAKYKFPYTDVPL